MATSARSTQMLQPLLTHWYRVVSDGDRLLLEHGESVVAFEGAAVRSLLPALLPLLDGTRSIDDIVGALGEPVREAVVRAAEMLAAHGLLVDGPPAGAPAQAVARVVGIAPAEARARLAAARVAIAGVDNTVISSLLRRAGVERVESYAGNSDVDLVIGFAGDVDLRELNRACVEARTPLLPIALFNGRHTLVGPIVVPEISACHECVQLRRAANLPFGNDFSLIEETSPTAAADPGLQAIAAGLATHLAVRWLATRDPLLPGTLFAISPLPRPTVAEHPVLRVPRCPVCSPAARMAAPLPWHAAEAL